MRGTHRQARSAVSVRVALDDRNLVARGRKEESKLRGCVLFDSEQSAPHRETPPSATELAASSVDWTRCRCVTTMRDDHMSLILFHTLRCVDFLTGITHSTDARLQLARTFTPRSPATRCGRE